MFGVATIAPDTIRIAPPTAWTRYAHIDEARYDHAPIDVPRELVAIAEKATGRSLRVTRARALRLSPGDYLLARHDTVHDDDPVEVVVEIASVPGAEVHYRRRGQVYFRVPSQPGTVAVIERGPTVTCNHVYVSKRQTNCVIRVVALLHHCPESRSLGQTASGHSGHSG